jgi:hypothetical protein
MQISVTVMAVPARKLQAEYLAAILRYYPFSDVSVTYDQIAAGTHESEWNNGANALRAGLGKGDWHVVIQDDAILTPNLYENIEGAIKNCPGGKALISLYTGKARPFPIRITEAVKKAYHATWLRHYLLIWGVGIVIPTSHIEPMIEFVDDRTEPYDTRIGIFYQRNRLPVYYTMPCLVDHDDELGTAIPGHGTKPGARVAHRLATGPVIWNDRVITI